MSLTHPGKEKIGTGLKLRVYSLLGTKIDRRSVFGLYWLPDWQRIYSAQGTVSTRQPCYLIPQFNLHYKICPRSFIFMDKIFGWRLNVV